MPATQLIPFAPASARKASQTGQGGQVHFLAPMTASAKKAALKRLYEACKADPAAAVFLPSLRAELKALA